MTHDLKLEDRAIITTLLRREAIAMTTTERAEARADAQKLIALALQLETLPEEKQPVRMPNRDATA